MAPYYDINKLFLPQNPSRVMLTFATTHLNLTWTLRHGTCKDELGSPLRYSAYSLASPLIHKGFVYHTKGPSFALYLIHNPQVWGRNVSFEIEPCHMVHQKNWWVDGDNNLTMYFTSCVCDLKDDFDLHFDPLHFNSSFETMVFESDWKCFCPLIIVNKRCFRSKSSLSFRIGVEMQ